MNRNNKILISSALLILFSTAVSAQQVLENYVRTGLSNNLALKQKSFDLQRAEIDLQRARALFYPQVDFQSQYNLAQGGRRSDLPIGDLLNNAYKTLNQLTGSSKFPQVGNQTIYFLPDNYQDTRIAVTMPLVNTEISWNRKIKQEEVVTQKTELEIYKRDLVKQIKLAWYQYIQAGKIVSVYRNALALARENLRVSEKFLENNLATKESVLRASSQVSNVDASLADVLNSEQNALALFNFLLNRPLQTPVENDSIQVTNVDQQPEISPGPQRREELIKLSSIEKTLAFNTKLNESTVFPKLNFFYNVGFQGTGYTFNSDRFYQLGGLQLQWTLFKGHENRSRIRQSQLETEAIKNQTVLAADQISLDQQTAMNNLHSAKFQLKAAENEVQSSRETYRLTERRYREGNALQLELIDARTQFTNSEIRLALTQLALLTRQAELERANATYQF